jgi:hypothetical protein
VSSRDKDIERDLAEDDGLRPDEVEGPDASEASPRRCEFRQGERTSGVGESDFEAAEELHESFPIEEIPVVMGPDGLPIVVDSNPEDAQAVPFTWDTQLCIEDDREFVEVFDEELDVLPPGVVARARYNRDGTDRERRRFEPEDVEKRWGMSVAVGEPHIVAEEPHERWIPVRPRRERCKHYRRQVFSNDSQPDPAAAGHQIVFRVCGARRSNGGAFMSLGNEGIYACDFRDPPDPKSTELQDSKDRSKLVDRPDLLHLPMFNMPGDAVQLENNVS